MRQHIRTFTLALLLTPLFSIAQEPISLTDLTEAAESGDSKAQFDLGNRYLYGDGVVADSFEAARWFQSAAEQGNNNAQYNLGVMYMQGNGVMADNGTAIEWFNKAADLGDPPAQFTLATMYANGSLLPRDPVLAHKWFTLAASAGHRAAEVNVILFQEMMSNEQIVEAQNLAKQWADDFMQQKAADDINTDAVQLRAGGQ